MSNLPAGSDSYPPDDHYDGDEAPSPLPPPAGADRIPPPPFTGYVHLFDRPGRTIMCEPPTVFQRDILESSGTWSSPDVWEVEVRYVRPMHPGATS